MKLIKNTILTVLLLVWNVVGTFAGNPVDSDLSNRAGSNSGNSHLDIYLFIVALLLLCIIVPYFEKKNKKFSKDI